MGRKFVLALLACICVTVVSVDAKEKKFKARDVIKVFKKHKWVNADGKKMKPGFKNHYILLYYSAKWCPHCRKFTPKLVEFYNANHAVKDFEVFFISGDKTIEAALAYMKDDKMLWPGLASLKNIFALQVYGAEQWGGGHISLGYPTLVVIDTKNNTCYGSTYFGEKKKMSADDVLERFKKEIGADK